MGFFDKIKAAASFITGGGAKVFVEAVNPSLQGFGVRVRAAVADADIKINKVYVQVRSTESVVIKDAHVTVPGATNSFTQTFTKDEELVKLSIDVAGPAELKAKSEQSWEGRVQLPGDARPTFIGRNATHKWFVMAALDKAGNDPDSGWVEVVIK